MTGRRVLSSAVLLTFFQLGSQAAQECNGGQGECPAVQREGALRWRPFPYSVSKPQFAKVIYGGGFVGQAFAQYFDGPEEGEDWDLLWTHRPQDAALASVALPPRSGRRLVNHCNYFAPAGNKCKLSRHTTEIRRHSEEHRSRHLRSYDLSNPDELAEWRGDVAENSNKIWVLKPCLGGASQGIQLAKGSEALDAQKGFVPETVAQEYVDEPFLGFGGRKFHLRLYILVPRWGPTVAYLYDNGLVFRSREDYAGSGPSTQRDIFSSISKNVEGLPLATLWQHLDNLSGPVLKAASVEGESVSKVVRQRLHNVLAELLSNDKEEQVGFEELESSRGYGCFDLLGADVLLDSKLQPYVLEFNIGPNLWIDNHGQEQMELLKPIKDPLVKQISQWTALRLNDADEKAEEEALRDFTRFL